MIEHYSVRLRGTYGRSYMGVQDGKPVWFSRPDHPEVLRFADADAARTEFCRLNQAAGNFYPEARIDIVS